jgi:hypothetical protein
METLATILVASVSAFGRVRCLRGGILAIVPLNAVEKRQNTKLL